MFKHTLIATSLVLAPLALIGCGDPCLDDGFVDSGKKCRADDIGATNTNTDGSNTDGSNTDDSGDSGGDSNNTNTGTNTNSNTDSNTNTNSNTDSNTGTNSDTNSNTDDLWCKDKDKDTFGDPNECMHFQSDPGGDEWVKDNTDCDDTNANTYPGAAEFETNAAACMKDEDQDGWGDNDPSNPLVTKGTDCDDANATTFPGAAQIEFPDKCANDSDDDGWADPDDGGQMDVTPGTDCNDEDPKTFPGAAELESTTACMKDEDDDGQGDDDPEDDDTIPGKDCDDSDPATFEGSSPKDDPLACMKDTDDDDWGDATPANPKVTPGTDCLDSDKEVFPGAAENETPANACMKDEDNDGWGDNDPPTGVTPGKDCNDTDAKTFPGSAEKDSTTACMKDEDDDGLGDNDPDDDDTEKGNDCDDSDASVGTGCLPPLVLTVPDNYEINKGAKVKLEAVAMGGSNSSNYVWTWTPAQGLSATNIAQPDASPEALKTYTVSVYDNVTKETKTAQVTVHVINAHVDIGKCAPGGIFKVGGLTFSGLDANTPLRDAEWVSQQDDDFLCQLRNNQPSAVICTDWLLENSEVTGGFRVSPNAAENWTTAANGVRTYGEDDDWAGFVWGVQENKTEYYLFSWKGADQSGHSGCPDVNASFAAGMYVKRISVTTGLTCGELVGSASGTQATTLANPDEWTVVQGDNIAQDGWNSGEDYKFHLEHRPTGSLIRMTSEDGSDVVEINIADNNYKKGYFGVFTMSQDNVCYTNYDSKPLVD